MYSVNISVNILSTAFLKNVNIHDTYRLYSVPKPYIKIQYAESLMHGSDGWSS